MDLNKFRDVDLVIDKANANFMQRQFVSQGDLKGRTLTVQITDRGVVGEVPGLTLNLRWHNVDSGLTDLSAFECIDKENSLFRIEYPTNMLTPGKVQANIQIIDGEKVTHLKTFEITVQRLSGEMVGVTGQAEYGALVAVLADANKFRTDIDFLGMDKASKEEVNQLATDKASNASLANSNKRIDGLASSKVDKGGNEQVTLPMLSQEVKTAMTGGSVAVVGAGAVNTSNIVDGSVTTAKVESAVATPLIGYTNKVKPNYDTATQTLTIPKNTDGSSLIFFSGSQWKGISMEEDIKVDASTLDLTTRILVLDFDTLTFNWQRLNDKLTKTQVPILTMRGNGQAIHSPYFDVTVDGKLFADSMYLPFIRVIPSQGRINANSKKLEVPLGITIENEILTFNKNAYGWHFLLNSIQYNNAIPPKGLSLNLGEMWEETLGSATDSGVLLWNSSGEFYLEQSNSAVKISARNNVGIIAIIRKGAYGTYWLETDIPWSCEGIYMGIFKQREAHLVKVLPGGPLSTSKLNVPVKVDWEKNSLIFPNSLYDYVFFDDDGNVIPNAIPASGLSIKIPNYTELGNGTSAIILMFNTQTKEFNWIPYNKYGSWYNDVYYITPWIIIGAVRRTIDNNSGKMVSFAADFPFPWVSGGKLYGIESESSSASIVSVPEDAAISNIFHRGYSLSYPENTLIAYRAAKKNGCNEVEMDLNYTSDGIPVNLHDFSINRTGRNLDGSTIDEIIYLNDLTYAETKNYEFGSWKSNDFLGEKLPTFEECLMLCKRLNMTLHVDRAWYMGGGDGSAEIKKIVERVGYDHIVWYINAQSQAQTIRNMFPKGDIYFLLAQGTDITQESIDTCVQYGLSSKIREGRCEILSTGNLATQPAIQNALDAGVKVNLWGADNIDRGQYAEWGVTGFSTDGINIIQELLEDI